MAADPPIYEDRHGRILAELAGMGVMLARELQERAIGAETVEEITRLAQAFHTVSRGVRQSLALEMKVIRMRNQLAREAKAEAAEEARRLREARAPSVWSRTNAVATQVERLIYNEAEFESEDFDQDRAEALQIALNRWLAVAKERPDFTTADVDELIVEACDAVGLDARGLYVFEGEDDQDPGDLGDDPELADPEGEGDAPAAPPAFAVASAAGDPDPPPPDTG
jgi:hypothetical protein